MEAGRESRVSGEVAAYSDARTSVIATSPSSELRPLMPNFAQQQFRAEHVSVGSETEVTAVGVQAQYLPLCYATHSRFEHLNGRGHCADLIFPTRTRNVLLEIAVSEPPHARAKRS
jgi:hypothetical protein